MEAEAPTLRSRLRGWLPVLAAAAVVGIGALVAIPLGGWDEVELRSRVLPEQPIGQPHAGLRLSTAIDDIYLAAEDPAGSIDLEPGEKVLVVVATIENLTDEPTYPFSGSAFPPFTVPGLVELGAVPAGRDSSTLLERDGTASTLLNPGVPDTFLFAFRVPSSQFAAGDEVRVGLTEAARAERADLYEGTRWVGVRVAVEVPMLLRDEG